MPARTVACAFLPPFPQYRHISQFSLPRSRQSPQVTSYRRLTSASTQAPDRGFRLLRSDLSRISRFLRGDLSALNDRSFTLPRYDPRAIAAYYDARPFTALIRVSAVGIPFLFWLFRVRGLDRWLGRSNNPNVTQSRASDLRQLLCWAGPTYLKIGQAVGNRPDLVGLVYSSELQKLVDDVGTFDSDVAVRIVTDELGVESIGDTFAQFNEHAVASASLGQVHRARLRTGEEVAVKVQRPTVERDAALDVYVLRRVANFAKKRFKLRSDLVGIVDEFATRLWEELDYVNEADNCERFSKLYAADNDDVYVPRVFRNASTKRVLTLEWIDGDKAPWFPREDARRLIRIGVQCSLQQLLDKGFVHADPHGGNLLRTKDGRLCYLDFGMCVQVDESIRYDLIAAIVRLINRDYENLADDFVKLGFLPKDADTSQFAPLLIKAFGDASTGDRLSDLSFSRLASNLSGVAFSTPIRIPVFFTLIIRSLTILEGFALQTDASFKIVDESYPYVVKRILTDDSPVFQRALRDVLIDSLTGRLRWKRLSALLRTRSSSVPEDEGGSGGAVRAATNTPTVHPSTSLTDLSDRALYRVLDFTLSERGQFLRDAILLELTDTVDAAQLALLQRASEATNGLVPAPSQAPDIDRLEAAVAFAQALRKRVPDIVSSTRGRVGIGDGVDSSESTRRAELLRAQVIEASRTVVGNMMERNTRRVFRKAISALFGGDRRRTDPEADV